MGVYSSVMFGRRAYFASYDDTTAITRSLDADD
jgi:hypothetical protein